MFQCPYQAGGLKIGDIEPPTCLCTTSNFFTNTMDIMVEMIIMVKTQDGHLDRDGRNGPDGHG